MCVVCVYVCMYMYTPMYTDAQTPANRYEVRRQRMSSSITHHFILLLLFFNDECIYRTEMSRVFLSREHQACLGHSSWKNSLIGGRTLKRDQVNRITGSP